MVTTKGTRPVTFYRQTLADIDRANADDMYEAAQDGKTFMQEFIRNRGTAYSRSQGRRGRTDTWRMHDAVIAQDSKFGANRRRAAFGWLRDRAVYFKAQEGGFEHNWTGKMVEGMYAMQDAAEIAFTRLEKRLRRRGMRKR